MFKKLLLLVMVLLMLLLLVVYPALHKAAGLPGRLPNAGPGIHCAVFRDRSLASSVHVSLASGIRCFVMYPQQAFRIRARFLLALKDVPC
jgi:hypothetical protein